MANIRITTETKLKTERLFLRYPNLEDAPEIFAIVQSREFPERLPLKELVSLNKVETWLKRLRNFWEEGLAYSWIMETRASGKLLGQVTLSKIDGDNVWALAFWTLPEQWGKGYATEGSKRILRFGFEDLSAKKIWAAAGKWNQGSLRVLEKLGMKYTGDNPRGYYSKGKPIATQEYEISLESWKATS